MFAWVPAIERGSLGDPAVRSATSKRAGGGLTGCTRDVSDPGQTGVLQLGLDDLQVSNLNSGCCEVRNLELDAYWALFPLWLGLLDTWQAQLGAHQELFTTSELLDLPDDGGLLRVVRN